VPGLTLEANLTETPPSSSDSPFPSATTTIPFGLSTAPQPKQVQASTGRTLRTLNSPSAFVTLDNIGTGLDVTQASTFYMRVRSGGFQVRLTYANPLGGSIIAITPLAGVMLIEPDAGGGFFITKVELQGSGQYELYASGSL
jgi:hypothetical protein